MSKKPRKKPVKAAKSAQAKESKGEFGIAIGEVFSEGFKGFASNAVVLIVAGIVVLVVFGAASIPWRAFDAELDVRVAADPDAGLTIFEQLQWVGLLLVAAFPAGVIAGPWFRYALDAADGNEIDIKAPLIDTQKLVNHAFATFWFWAGITLGLRYWFLIPGSTSAVVLLLYPFYAYVIASGHEINGLKALGVSVRLGQGRRLGLFAIAGLFFMFNLFGLLGLGVGLEANGGSPTILGIALGIVGLSVTASITLVSGAAIYRVLEGKL